MFKYATLIIRICCILSLAIFSSQNILAASSFFAVSNLQQKITDKKITLIDSDVEVAKITGASIKDTNANWTKLAEQNFQHIFEEIFSNTDFDCNFQLTITNQKLVELIALQRIVEKSILSNFQSPLPTKNNYSWSIGSDSSLLKRTFKADYGLFVFIRAGFKDNDQVSYQTALISLVELNTGKTVWFNAQTNLPGDLRHPDKSLDTMSALFQEIPGANQNF